MSDGTMTVVLPTRDLIENQRSFELRKFFAPPHVAKTHVDSAFKESLNNDGALDAYAETIIWRLRGVHAMVSLIDRGHQYFLAGAVRGASKVEEDDEANVINQNAWFGCSSVPTPGGLCENTLALDITKDDYPCFTVSDLSQDERFRSLPVVDGSIASYRFYAGTPITTDHGVNIGSFFLFDNKPRDDLTLPQRKFLHQQATNIMKHLATKREAAERRRAALMSKGIGDFLERASQYRDLSSRNESESDDNTPSEDKLPDGAHNISPEERDVQGKESVLDRIRITLVHAANILRESLELTAGGVVFLDAAVGHAELNNIDVEDHMIDSNDRKRRETMEGALRPPSLQEYRATGRHLSQGLIRSSTDKHKPPKILAVSAANANAWSPKTRILNSKTMGSLTKSYPKGNVWAVDEEGFYSSLGQIHEWEKTGGTKTSEKRRSIPPADLTTQRSEAAILSQIFPKARQIMFLPLWDAAADRWYAGSFVWSQSAMPVFTLESELAYLSAFTNSMMVEISRLDAVIANKMKSDFIGSISHEFRSPLHGILASAEFLRDSTLDSSQAELVATIQNCSGTLLDTINHVLDYSKINSFETSGNQQGPVSNELYQVTNLAMLCEDVVEGMVAANSFRGASFEDPSVPSLPDAQPRGTRRIQHQHHSPLAIVVDIEQRDWDFRVEAGALRRIVMNLFGNAQKFTQTGYIMVDLRILDVQGDDETKPPATVLSLNLRDSGKGMSSDFMERKLYHPFCQEDTFAPGVGLGLSIVWTIINQLGGKIQVRSEQEKGTDVEVTLPVEKAKPSAHTTMKPGDLMGISADAEQHINRLRSRAMGKSVCFSRRKSTTPGALHRESLWSCIERYCFEWFGFEIKTLGADIIITDDNRIESTDGQRVLVIHEDMNCSYTHNGSGVSSLCNPVGPFKLARSILNLMDQEFSNESSVSGVSGNRSDIGTQTPLGSPMERTILNGIIMTDYGFSPPTTFCNTPNQPAPQPQSATEYKPQEQNGDEQAFAAVQAASGMTLRLPRRRKTVQVQNSAQNTTSDSFSTQRKSSPRSIPLPASPPKSPILAATTKPSSLRILAVDDNDINLQLLHRSLLKRKLDTTDTAKTGLEAVDAVRKGGVEGKYDVIFMDISMPEMDGFEATRLIRSFERSVAHRSFSDAGALSPSKGIFQQTIKDTRKLKGYFDVETGNNDSWREFEVERKRNKAYIVALTGLASRRDRDEAEQSGFDDFLTKPISFKKIGELLDRLSAEKGGTL